MMVVRSAAILTGLSVVLGTRDQDVSMPKNHQSGTATPGGTPMPAISPRSLIENACTNVRPELGDKDSQEAGGGVYL